MDELICRLVDCINELDEIAEELVIEHSINARDLEIASHLVNEYKKRLSTMLEAEEYVPDLYHIKTQERLDAEAKGEWVS